MLNRLGSVRLKRFLNGLYTWLSHLLHSLVDLLPGFIRVWVWRPLLGRCGRGVAIDHRVYFKYPWLVHLGDDVSINRGAEFYPGLVGRARITIGSGVRIAPNVRIHAAGHDPEDPNLGDIARDISVGNHAWLGAGCILLPGVSVGDGAIVAAGAVVTRDVPAGVIVGGVPAQKIRDRTVRKP